MRFIFPGSFDPPTLGHLELIERAAAICDELIVAVFINPAKKGLIPYEKRCDLLKKICKKIKNAKICISSGMLSDIIREENCDAIVRGVRNLSDYEAERDRATANRMLSGVDTILLYSKPEYLHISSSVVRELMHFGGDIGGYIPSEIIEDVLYYKNN